MPEATGGGAERVQGCPGPPTRTGWKGSCGFSESSGQAAVRSFKNYYYYHLIFQKFAHRHHGILLPDVVAPFQV